MPNFNNDPLMPGHLGRYTDVPGRPGYEYAPGKPWWKDYPREPERRRELQRPPRPPERFQEFMSPDYSRREDFENEVFSEIGGNPFEINPMDEVKKADAKLPALFNHVFGGTVYYGDIDKLDKDQRAYWENSLKQYHAQIYQESISKKKVMLDRYNHMMNRFDNAANEYGARLSAYQSQMKEWAKTQEAKIKEERKAPTTKTIGGKLYQWNPDTKKFEDTGIAAEKEPKKPTSAAIGRIAKSVEELNELDPKSAEFSRKMKAINGMLKAEELPPIKKRTTKGEKRKWWFDIPPKVEYVIGYGGEEEKKEERTIVETRYYKGRKLVKYSDGSVEFVSD